MAKVNKNQLLDVYSNRINTNTSKAATPTTSATLLNGGRAASQAA